MKKEYTEPDAEFVEFDIDIIATSGPGVDDGTIINKEDCGGAVWGGLTF